MSNHYANYPHLHLVSSYLLFVLENNTLVCKDAFTTEQDAFAAAADVNGFVVDAFQVGRIHKKHSLPAEEKVHELRFED